jgi:DNA-binding SARP family transcriptional activator
MVKTTSKTHQTMLAIRLLGNPEIALDGVPVRLPFLKAEALLCYLAATAQPHSRRSLASIFWGGSPEKKARNSLRNALYTINRVLAPAHCLDVDRSTVRFHKRHVWVDATEFEGAVVRYEHSEQLSAALQWWRAPFMDGVSLPDAPVFEGWMVDRQAHFQRLYLDALLRLNELYQQQQQWEAAGKVLEQLLTLDPLHEIGHQQLMRLQANRGNRAAALRQFDRMRQVLREELGVDPSRASQQLHVEILRSDETQPRDGVPAPAQQFHFVGRQQELALLRQYYQTSLPAGPAQMLMLEGEVGIGKTRLAREWLRTVSGARILTARCYETEQAIPFQPWIDLIQHTFVDTELDRRSLSDVWLAELAHLVPDIRRRYPDLAIAPVTDPELTRGRIIQAIYHWLGQLARKKPVCLFIDDWQWLDNASMTLLRHMLLSSTSSRLPLFILATRRESKETASWVQFKAMLAREGRLRSIVLQRLSPLETSTLARAMALPARFQTADFVERLFAETEGNPLFLVEMLHSLKSEQMDGDVDWPLPATIQSVIQSRLARLNEDTVNVLTVAAVAGRTFTENDLQQVINDQPDMVGLQAIDEAVAANILVEQGTSYDFTHDKIRTVLLESLTNSRRRYLHQQVARSLEATMSNDFGRLSYHFELAGDALRARGYALRAAKQAAELYADEEALRWYDKAESLLGATPAELSPEAISKVTPFQQSHVARSQPLDVHGLICRQRGIIYQRVGRYPDAENSFMAALERGAVRQRLDEQGAAHNLLSFLAYLRSDYDGVGLHARQSLELAGLQGEAALRAPGLRHLGIAVYHTGDYEQAHRLYDEALAAYRQANDLLGVAGVYNNIGYVLRTQARYAEAIEAFQKAGFIYETMHQIEGIALIHSNLGRTYAFKGDLTQALAVLTKGLALSEEAHTDWITVKIHRTLGNVFAHSQQWAQALDHAQAAQRLAQALGSEEDLGVAMSLLGKIAAAWPEARLGPPDHYFDQSVKMLQRVGAQDELARVQAAIAAHQADVSALTAM